MTKNEKLELLDEMQHLINKLWGESTDATEEDEVSMLRIEKDIKGLKTAINIRA